MVRFDLAADPSNLNPLFLHQDASSVEQQIARLLFEPFADIDARGRPVPALLARLPTRANGDLSADGRTIVYRLRREARWSDGVPVTSSYVLFTLRAILDPRNPVPSLGGRSCCRYTISPMGPADQRPVEITTAVLVYTATPLTEDVEVTGTVSAVLFAATSARDTDWTVKLVDVHPDGGAINIADGILRARYRDSLSAPSLLDPGRLY